MLSLLASAVQEGIASLLALRAKTLLRGLRNMLDGTEEKPADNSVLSMRFYEHPLIRSLVPAWPRPAQEVCYWGRPAAVVRRSAFGALALLDTVASDIAMDPETQQKRGDLNVIAYVTTALESANLPPGAGSALLLARLSKTRGGPR